MSDLLSSLQEQKCKSPKWQFAYGEPKDLVAAQLKKAESA